MKSPITILLLSLIPLQFTMSCSEFEFLGAEEDSSASDTALELPTGEIGLAFRLDVLASKSINDSLLDETFLIAAGEGEDLTLNLSNPAIVSGRLSGFAVSPTSDVTLPGEIGGISGIVRAWVPDSVMSYSSQILDDGLFELPLVPHEEYVFSWTPSHGIALPFYVDEGVTVSGDTERNVLLSWDNSVPIYGSVSSGDESPLHDIHIQIFDSSTGAIGPSADTSDIGGYNLRLYPGVYDIELSGRGDEGVPTITQQLIVGEDDLAIDSATDQFANVTTIKADGRVLTPLGVPANGVLVRFTSLSIKAVESVELVSESTTGSNGRFSIPILQGVYQVEFIPPHDEGYSPYMITEVSFDDDVTELATVNLSIRETISGQVLDALGMPAEGVILRAEELEFNNLVYQTVTGEDGKFEIQIPDAKLFWTLMPSNSRQGAITFGQGYPEDWDGVIVQLRTGQPINGCVFHDEGGAAFAPLELRSVDGRFFGFAFTDENGCFDLRIDIETQSPDSR